MPAYGLHTDLAGHGGGAVGGALVGLLLLRLWSKGHEIPRAGAVVTAVPVVFGIAAALALAFAVYDNALWAAFATDLPASYATMVQHAAPLYDRYPHDPRVRYARAVALYADGKKEDAGVILQGTLDDRGRVNKLPEIEGLTRSLLALIQEESGAHALARASIAPLCGTAQANIRQIVDRLCR